MTPRDSPINNVSYKSANLCAFLYCLSLCQKSTETEWPLSCGYFPGPRAGCVTVLVSEPIHFQRRQVAFPVRFSAYFFRKNLLSPIIVCVTTQYTKFRLVCIVMAKVQDLNQRPFPPEPEV